jgi:DNA replicative helicase MCM subunit Mcm2 (Cdc46/Mcm family)
VQVSELPHEHVQTLVDYYMKNRTQIDVDTNKMLTNRFMEHGQNLAIYMARIKGKACPGEEEIFHTMELLEKSLDVAAFDPKTGKHDYNPYNNIRPASEIAKMNQDEQFEQAVKNALRDADGKKKEYFTLDDLIYECYNLPKTHWPSENKIVREFEKWKKAGKVIEKHGAGKYSL